MSLLILMSTRIKTLKQYEHDEQLANGQMPYNALGKIDKEELTSYPDSNGYEIVLKFDVIPER